MALSDRITFDGAGLSDEAKAILYKGIAYQQGLFNSDGSLDISSPSTLVVTLKSQIASHIISLAREAIFYENSLSNATDILENA